MHPGVKSTPHKIDDTENTTPRHSDSKAETWVTQPAHSMLDCRPLSISKRGRRTLGTNPTHSSRGNRAKFSIAWRGITAVVAQGVDGLARLYLGR